MNSISKLLLVATIALFSNGLFGQQETDIPFVDLPPTNEYGKCYAKCKSPDIYETVSREVLVKPEGSKLSIVPAQYETRTETVLVKEAAVGYNVVPATYKNVTERILVRPESKKLRVIPAKYGKESKQVLVSPARGAWVKKKKDPNCFSQKPEDCYIACYEEIPAQYRTETYQVLVEPARTVEEVIPAKYETYTRRAVDQPASVSEYPIDAKYKTISTKILVSPAASSEVIVPAKYKTVTEKVLVREGGYTVWTEILCASQTTSSTVRAVQTALKAAGYNPGPIDGVMGLQTQTALKQFQTDKSLPIGNLNLETLRSLGVKF